MVRQHDNKEWPAPLVATFPPCSLVMPSSRQSHQSNRLQSGLDRPSSAGGSSRYSPGGQSPRRCYELRMPLSPLPNHDNDTCAYSVPMLQGSSRRSTMLVG